MKRELGQFCGHYYCSNGRHPYSCWGEAQRAEGSVQGVPLVETAIAASENVPLTTLVRVEASEAAPFTAMMTSEEGAETAHRGNDFFANTNQPKLQFMEPKDPSFWTYRPLSEQMVRAAADDVHFLPYINHKMMGNLNEQSLWKLATRGALYCRCFCADNTEYADWPAVPSIPGGAPEEEILSALGVPPGKMGCIIGRRGSSILSIKESCDSEIIIGGSKGPPDKVFIIGPVKPVKKAEAILRGKMVGNAF